VNPDRSVAVLAHGLGGSADLPIPLAYALIGAAWALTFTFAVVALAWRKPQFDPDKPGRALPRWVTSVIDASVTRWVASLAALSFAARVAIAANVGPQDASNPLPGVFYVLTWVGLVAVSLAVGPVWRLVSPVRTVHRLLGKPSRRPYPESWGYWPAVGGLFAFVWLELASPDPGSLGAIKVWLLVYLAVTLAGSLWCGQRWCARADPFEVYSVVASRLSPFRRNRDGRIAIGNPFDHLPSLPVRHGTVAVCWRCCWDRLRSTAFRPHRRGATSSTTTRDRPSRRHSCALPGCWCSPRWWRARSGWRLAPPVASTGNGAASCPG
jgi:hypothetical protein